MADTKISISGLRKEFRVGNLPLTALERCDLEVRRSGARCDRGDQSAACLHDTEDLASKYDRHTMRWIPALAVVVRRCRYAFVRNCWPYVT